MDARGGDGWGRNGREGQGNGPKLENQTSPVSKGKSLSNRRAGRAEDGSRWSGCLRRRRCDRQSEAVGWYMSVVASSPSCCRSSANIPTTSTNLSSLRVLQTTYHSADRDNSKGFFYPADLSSFAIITVNKQKIRFNFAISSRLKISKRKPAHLSSLCAFLACSLHNHCQL